MLINNRLSVLAGTLTTAATSPILAPISVRVRVRLGEINGAKDRNGLKGRPLSENTHGKLSRDLGFESVTHGFRLSVRDYAAERTHTSHAVMKASLAHSIRIKADAAYARGDLFEKRRVSMASWAQYLAS